MKTINLEVKGMHCSSCEMLIKDVIEDEKGVSSCNPSMAKNSVEIEFDENEIQIEKLKELIEKEGYKVN